jgi:hypothetical protein
MGTTGKKGMSTTQTLSTPLPSIGIDLIITTTNGEEVENTQ